MHDLGYEIAAGMALCCIAASVVCGVLSYRLSISRKKGRLRLSTTCFFGAGIVIAALRSIGYMQSLPIYHGSGTIQQVRIYSRVRGHRTLLWLAMEKNETVVLDASGTSPFFRTGEYVTATYRGQTGSIVRAIFRNRDQAIEGQFHGTDYWPPCIGLFMGLAIICSGVILYRRDAEGAESRDDRPVNAVSFHLSGKGETNHDE